MIYMLFDLYLIDIFQGVMVLALTFLYLGTLNLLGTCNSSWILQESIVLLNMEIE